MKLLRALRGRCPVCGAADVWRRWGQLRETCPGCGYRFEREEGYWVGALIVNLGLAELVFGVGFVATLALTYPDVPWTGIIVAGLLVTVGLPILAYPRSKTLWVWLDQAVHPHEGEERDWEGRGAHGHRAARN